MISKNINNVNIKDVTLNVLTFSNADDNTDRNFKEYIEFLRKEIFNTDKIFIYQIYILLKAVNNIWILYIKMGFI